MKSLILALFSFFLGVAATLVFVSSEKMMKIKQVVNNEQALKTDDTAANKALMPFELDVSREQEKSIDETTTPIDSTEFTDKTQYQLTKNADIDISFRLFKKNISNGDFKEALLGYRYVSVDPRFRLYIFDYLYQQLASENIERYSLVKKLSQQLLELEYDDFYFNFLKVKSSYLLEQYRDVIETVILLKDNIMDEKFREAVEYYYRQTLDHYAKELLTSTDVFQIEDFIFQLTYIDEATIVSQLNKRLKEIEKTQYLADLYSMKIPVTPFGPNLEHGIVTVVLNNEVNVKLMIDSGASTISLDESMLKGLSYNLVQADRIYNTANGQISTNLVEIDSLTIGGVAIPNVQLSAHKADNPIGNPYFDGLLGRNFLNLFNWHHDSNESVLYLEPK